LAVEFGGKGNEVIPVFKHLLFRAEHQQTVVVGDIVLCQQAVTGEVPKGRDPGMGQQSKTQVEQFPVRENNDIFGPYILLDRIPKGPMELKGGLRYLGNPVFQVSQYL